MFEWNEEDELKDTIWGDLIDDSEDHIVPYPKICENHALFGYEGYANKLKDEKQYVEPGPYEQNELGQNFQLPRRNEGPTAQYNGELPGCNFHIDSWPAFSSIESSIRKEGDGNDQGSASSTIFDDFTDPPNFDDSIDNVFALTHSEGLENDSEPWQTEVDSFLDCDWANIADLGDLDEIFRNSDCGLERDTLLSPTSSIKASEEPVRILESKESHPRDRIQDDQKAREQKKKLKIRKKVDEKSTPNSDKLVGTDSHITNPIKHLDKLHPAVPAFYQSAAFHQQRQIGEPAYLGYYPSPQMVIGYGYPVHPYPSVPLVSFVPPANKNSEPVLAGNVYPGHEGHCNPVKVQNEALPRTSSMMTPQEKIEKLRRRQQMQALLGIKQQEKQFGKKVTPVNVALCQSPSSVRNSAKNEELVPFSELNTGQAKLHNNTSSSSVDHLLRENIFRELQETVSKLDHNVRSCMHDSLFRLAESAMERRRPNDGSLSMSIKDENDFTKEHEDCKQKRLVGFTDVETDTNPIDRTVAHLLFHRPSQQPFRVLGQSNAFDDLQEEVTNRYKKGKASL